MTRRLLDKKSAKLSFNESFDEQDIACNWDLNFSSDEDIFLKGKSEILWSRSRDLFDSPDSYESFSNLSGRTLSSCSWHNDEFDMKSSSKVNASLEAIDNALYEKIKSPLLNDVVFQECCDWAERFPYFRIRGKQITASKSNSFASYLINSDSKNISAENYVSSLHLEGKKFPIYSTNKSKEISSENSDNKILTTFEEIKNEEEEYEEYFAVHKSDEPSEGGLKIPTNNNSKAHTTLKLLQDKVIDKIIFEMWPSVLAFLEKLDIEPSSIETDLQLPPIDITKEQKSTISLKRPKTEGSDVVTTEFPKLESILTVSPKVLQKREFGYINRAARPNSEMSVNSRVPSKSMKSAYPHSRMLSNCVHISSERQLLKTSTDNREQENLCLVLPALEEDFQDSSVLRGFHIEPSRKELSTKIVRSSRNEYNKSSTPRENNYFLPPIDDKNYVPSDLKLTKNLFTFYESPFVQDKKTLSSSVRHKKTSRPNTSVSKKSVKNHEVTQKVHVNSELYITARGVSKITSNVFTEKNSEVSNGAEAVEGSPETSVTLFPIVKSLTPHEDKNNNNIKKSILKVLYYSNILWCTTEIKLTLTVNIYVHENIRFYKK